MKIAMWSGPRNLSTALMYAFAARGDCAVVDEPFYAAYLHATGIDHPMRAEVIASQSTDPTAAAAACIGPIPQAQSLFYQKHMTLHMIPEFDRAFLTGLTNVFLIRHPAHVVASYARKREGPRLQDLGFTQQSDIFNLVADTIGRAPLVIDSADIRSDPETMLKRLCTALSIPFYDRMLHWPAGGNRSDGVWAPHWYGAVHRSTGFEAAEGPLPTLPPAYAALAESAVPFYDHLSQYRL